MEANSELEYDSFVAVPENERISWFSMAFIQAGVCVCVPAFLLGSLLAEGMSIKNAILSGTIGYVIVVVVMTILGFMGSDLGLPCCKLCESSMGKKGARYIVSALFAINLAGWFGINNAVCAEAFSNVMSNVFSINMPFSISCIIFGIITLITAICGVNALEKLDKISIPILMIIMILGTYLALESYGVAGLNSVHDETMSFIQGIGLSFNFYAVGAIVAADYTRFQKTRKDVVKSTFWGVFPMGVITLVLGVLMTVISNEYDISMVLIKVGIPVLGLTSLVLSSWTTNTSNAYSSALNILMFFNMKEDKRKMVTAVSGIIGIVLSAAGILTNIEGFLSLLSFLVCPIGGVMIADYFIIGKGKPERWKEVEGFNIAGVMACLLGAICAYYFKIEYLGIIVSTVIYLIIKKVQR